MLRSPLRCYVVAHNPKAHCHKAESRRARAQIYWPLSMLPFQKPLHLYFKDILIKIYICMWVDASFFWDRREVLRLQDYILITYSSVKKKIDFF